MTAGQDRGLLRPFMELSLQLAQDRDLDRVLGVVVDKAMDTTGARYGAALTVGPSRRIERFVQRGLTPEEVARLPHTPRGEGLLGEVLARRRPMRLARLADHPASVGFPDAHVAMGPFLSVPLERAGDLIGALYLTKEPGREPFSADDEELVLALARIAAVAIDNARDLADQAQRVQRAALLRAAATRIRHSLEVAEVLDATVRTLGLLAGVDRCLIRLMSDGKLGPVSHEWVAPGVEPLLEHPGPPPEAAFGAALTGATQWIDDTLAEAQGGARDVPARALLAAPLRWGDEVLGVVSFHSLLPRAWSASDIELIEDAAREVSIALHHGSLYAEARAAAQRLEELDRLRSDFIAMVSHELRSPMAVIVGIADIMSRRIDELAKEQRDELLVTLSREARRLARLVSEVLDVEALDRGGLKLRLSEVDLSELVNEAVADSGVAERIALSAPPHRAAVLGDADRIKQVLINLITNAAKYAPDDAIDVSLAAGSDGWVTSVRDRGPGIPPEARTRVFQRFTRLEGSGARPGWGLGLYLARALVQAHGGEIWVEDPPDGPGAVFAFRLPAAGSA